MSRAHRANTTLSTATTLPLHPLQRRLTLSNLPSPSRHHPMFFPRTPIEDAAAFAARGLHPHVAHIHARIGTLRHTSACTPSISLTRGARTVTTSPKSVKDTNVHFDEDLHLAIVVASRSNGAFLPVFLRVLVRDGGSHQPVVDCAAFELTPWLLQNSQHLPSHHVNLMLGATLDVILVVRLQQADVATEDGRVALAAALASPDTAHDYTTIESCIPMEKTQNSAEGNNAELNDVSAQSETTGGDNTSVCKLQDCAQTAHDHKDERSSHIGKENCILHKQLPSVHKPTLQDKSFSAVEPAPRKREIKRPQRLSLSTLRKRQSSWDDIGLSDEEGVLDDSNEDDGYVYGFGQFFYQQSGTGDMGKSPDDVTDVKGNGEGVESVDCKEVKTPHSNIEDVTQDMKEDLLHQTGRMRSFSDDCLNTEPSDNHTEMHPDENPTPSPQNSAAQLEDMPALGNGASNSSLSYDLEPMRSSSSGTVGGPLTMRDIARRLRVMHPSGSGEDPSSDAAPSFITPLSSVDTNMSDVEDAHSIRNFSASISAHSVEGRRTEGGEVPESFCRTLSADRGSETEEDPQSVQPSSVLAGDARCDGNVPSRSPRSVAFTRPWATRAAPRAFPTKYDGGVWSEVGRVTDIDTPVPLMLWEIGGPNEHQEQDGEDEELMDVGDGVMAPRRDVARLQNSVHGVLTPTTKPGLPASVGKLSLLQKSVLWPRRRSPAVMIEPMPIDRPGAKRGSTKDIDRLVSGCITYVDEPQLSEEDREFAGSSGSDMGGGLGGPGVVVLPDEDEDGDEDGDEDNELGLEDDMRMGEEEEEEKEEEKEEEEEEEGDGEGEGEGEGDGDGDGDGGEGEDDDGVGCVRKTYTDSWTIGSAGDNVDGLRRGGSVGLRRLDSGVKRTNSGLQRTDSGRLARSASMAGVRRNRNVSNGGRGEVWQMWGNDAKGDNVEEVGGFDGGPHEDGGEETEQEMEEDMEESADGRGKMEKEVEMLREAVREMRRRLRGGMEEGGGKRGMVDEEEVRAVVQLAEETERRARRAEDEAGRLLVVVTRLHNEVGMQEQEQEQEHAVGTGESGAGAGRVGNAWSGNGWRRRR